MILCFSGTIWTASLGASGWFDFGLNFSEFIYKFRIKTHYAGTPLDVMVLADSCFVDRESVLIDLASSLTLIESIITVTGIR